MSNAIVLPSGIFDSGFPSKIQYGFACAHLRARHASVGHTIYKDTITYDHPTEGYEIWNLRTAFGPYSEILGHGSRPPSPEYTASTEKTTRYWMLQSFIRISPAERCHSKWYLLVTPVGRPT